MIPRSARLMSKSAAWMRRRRMFSTSSPTYPASVRLVASAMANGTSRILARVCARYVLPQPVGPTSSTFDFVSSTSPTDFEALLAEVDALVADEHAGPGDELADLFLTLPQNEQRVYRRRSSRSFIGS